ncbi:hypothetical protein BJ170DRAFT_427047 [Xylariales sp. AK1849]|nr:hypothetical protein BJ170DRAFT_427047 [Xylariales sp. AK1849]
MAQLDDVKVKSGGKERIQQCAQLMTAIFQDDPVFNWFLYSTPDSQHGAHLAVLVRTIVKACALDGGYITEVGDWAASAVAMPPGRKADGFINAFQAGLVPVMITLGISPCKRILLEYSEAADKVKSKGMTRQEKKAFWYVAIMGTATDRRRQGLAGKLIQDIQQRARQDGRPVWLEATTPESYKTYAKHGFGEVEEMVLGKGKVGPNGRAKSGGEGITIWGMVWRPEKENRV